MTSCCFAFAEGWGRGGIKWLYLVHWVTAVCLSIPGDIIEISAAVCPKGRRNTLMRVVKFHVVSLILHVKVHFFS